MQRSDPWTPSDINNNLLTHLNLAYALIGADHRLAAMHDSNAQLYTSVVDLKSQNARLKVSLAVGGPVVDGVTFSNMARTEETRAVFVQSVRDVMDTYGFDGVDLAWEHPDVTDGDDYVHLVHELRRALPARALITVAIPTSACKSELTPDPDHADFAVHLKHYNLKAMTPFIDWVSCPCSLPMLN